MTWLKAARLNTRWFQVVKNVTVSRPPSRSITIHNLPFRLKSFVKPDMALQNNARSCVDGFDTR